MFQYMFNLKLRCDGPIDVQCHMRRVMCVVFCFCGSVILYIMIATLSVRDRPLSLPTNAYMTPFCLC